MSHDAAWSAVRSSWWVKAGRASEHLETLRRQLGDFRASAPYTVIPEPANSQDRCGYRLRVDQPMPVATSATVGDVAHNLRSALDNLAYAVAVHSTGRALNENEAKACEFPVCESPSKFETFFNNRTRATLYGTSARAALRSVQPFALNEEARARGVTVTRTDHDAFRMSVLCRLTRLWNIDKHRRLAVTAWVMNLVYWPSDDPTHRMWLPGDGTFVDGSILGYVIGSDPDIGEQIFHEFDLVLADDPAYDPAMPEASRDVLPTLDHWHRQVTGPIFHGVFHHLSN
jgi:hypothetical protein